MPIASGVGISEVMAFIDYDESSGALRQPSPADLLVGAELYGNTNPLSCGMPLGHQGGRDQARSCCLIELRRHGQGNERFAASHRICQECTTVAPDCR